MRAFAARMMIKNCPRHEVSKQENVTLLGIFIALLHFCSQQFKYFYLIFKF